jgi:tetratricopeptide (TPR) repeat protein
MLSPHALRERLGDVLDVADRSHSDRHRTLRATIEWSYGLLSPADQLLFRRLSVFAGGARLEAVEHVAAELDEVGDAFESLEALAEASLVEVREDEAGESRVHLLNTTRAFAMESLTAGDELDSAYAALARWCRDLVEDPARFIARSYAAWSQTARVDAELDNLRTALEWLVEGRSGSPAEDLVDTTLAVAATYHGHARGAEQAEALGWFRQATDWADQGAPSLTRASACLNLAWELVRTDPEASARLGAQGRRLLEAVPDADRTSPRGRQLELLAGEVEAVASWRAGDLAGASDQLTALLDGDMASSTRLLLLITYSNLLAAMGRTEDAYALEREAADLARSLGDLTNSLLMEVNSGCSLRELGRAAEAEEVMRSAIPRMVAESPPPRQVPTMAEDFAAVLVDNGKAEQGALLWGAADGARTRFGLEMGDAQLAETADTLAQGKQLLGPRWDELVAEGRTHDLEALLLETASSRSG